MQEALRIAVFRGAEGEGGGIVAGMRVHGVFASMVDAQAAIRQWMEEDDETSSYIIEECNHWISVEQPLKGTGQEEEEVGVAENQNAALGRMGSVCEIRNPSSPQRRRVPGAVPGTVPGTPPVPSPPDAVDEKPKVRPCAVRPRDAVKNKKREARTQQQILDDALGAKVPERVDGAAAYASLRERYATLRAFERRLRSLERDSVEKCVAALRRIRVLDEQHPTYAAEYKENYQRALRGSGMKPEDVPFMTFLDDLDALSL